MSDSGSRVTVLDIDKGRFHIRIDGENGPMEVITNLSQNGNQLVLSGLHIQGSGAGSSSLRELREAAREIGSAYGASEVLIQGGERSSGANPGHTPRDISIKVNK